ncbi:MAG TPA: pyridoxamine 5'-phosphate oxidase family protein [Pseudonocardiaceae bacterium]|nr:pyridoxamine 5'-phosphate oxidase family protein [Pseudonocardiaceae bacterium]
MPLSIADREAFLAQPHIGALAIAAGTERAPLTLPIWYQYEPGGELWFMVERRSRKTPLIEAAGRVSLMVDRTTPTVRYVSIEGPVVTTEPGTLDQLREMATRYLPPDSAEQYLAFAASDHADQLTVRVRPERWYSSDLGAF